MKTLCLLAVVSLCLLLPTAASAQVVVNPNFAQFTPSADHDVVENTVPLLTNYELRVFVVNTTASPVAIMNVGKPAPVSGVIKVTITTTLATIPPGDYYAVVAAKGPGGENVSLASNPFQLAVRKPVAPTNLTVIK